MDLLDRLLGHDSWTTKEFLDICSRLSDEQIDQEFDIGHRTIRCTLDHMIWNIECWTDLMRGLQVRIRELDTSVESLIRRFAAASGDFGCVARRITDDKRINEDLLDTLDSPPAAKSFGGVMLHVVTHGMHHRSQLLYMLRKLGVSDLPEGDVLTWEQTVGGDS